MKKTNKQIMSGIIWGMILVIYGLVYILFPNLINKFHLNFGLGSKGILIFGIILIALGIILGLLIIFSKFYVKYKKKTKKYAKLFTILYISKWVITIFILMIFGAVSMRVVQSIVG